MTDQNDPRNKESWLNLKQTITALDIFNTDNYTDSFLGRRVDCRLRVLSIKTYDDYAYILMKDPEERKRLYKELTITVTHFFRDSAPYTLLINDILPQIFARKVKEKQKILRVWSAGCATGEEPYSLAMAIIDALERCGIDNTFSIKILATDIDKDSIQKARIGIYEEKQFKETDKKYIDRHFHKIEGGFQVKPDIKSMVEFRQGDILTENFITHLDILVCRNTVIYFNERVKPKLYMKFYDCLDPGGFLILGKTESIMGEMRAKFKVINSAEKIFMKEPKDEPKEDKEEK